MFTMVLTTQIQSYNMWHKTRCSHSDTTIFVCHPISCPGILVLHKPNAKHPLQYCSSVVNRWHWQMLEHEPTGFLIKHRFWNVDICFFNFTIVEQKNYFFIRISTAGLQQLVVVHSWWVNILGLRLSYSKTIKLDLYLTNFQLHNPEKIWVLWKFYL